MLQDSTKVGWLQLHALFLSLPAAAAALVATDWLQH
jgi:hypothetical protein